MGSQFKYFYFQFQNPEKLSMIPSPPIQYTHWNYEIQQIYTFCEFSRNSTTIIALE